MNVEPRLCRRTVRKGSAFPNQCQSFSEAEPQKTMGGSRKAKGFPHCAAAKPQPQRLDRYSLKLSVALTRASAIPGSVTECPASGMTSSFASGQARCSSQALLSEQMMS